jgi:hypothetical protein
MITPASAWVLDQALERGDELGAGRTGALAENEADLELIPTLEDPDSPNPDKIRQRTQNRPLLSKGWPCPVSSENDAG